MLSALECKADYLQPVNDITRKPTLIASLSTALQDVSKMFENTKYSSSSFSATHAITDELYTTWIYN